MSRLPMNKPTVTVTSEGYTTTFPDGSQRKATWSEPLGDEAESKDVREVLELEAAADWQEKQQQHKDESPRIR